MYDCTCDEGYVFVNGNDCTEEDLDCSGDEFSCDLVCTSDVNHDGTVNIVDLLVMLGFFGSEDGQLDIDGSGDGVCNVIDLLHLLMYFGGNCPTSG